MSPYVSPVRVYAHDHANIVGGIEFDQDDIAIELSGGRHLWDIPLAKLTPTYVRVGLALDLTKKPQLNLDALLIAPCVSSATYLQMYTW